MIIDIHAHGCTPGGNLAVNEERLLRASEKYDIAKIYISNLLAVYPTKEQVDEGNLSASRFMKKHPDKIGGFVYISHEHDNAVDVLKRGIEEQGFEGVKIWVSEKCDSPLMDKVAEKTIEYGVPMLIHAFHKSRNQLEKESVGKNIANLAKRFPELKIIMAHFGGNPYNGIPMIQDIKNVWIDISCSMFHGDYLDYTVERIGAERILFGTDMCGPFLNNVGKVLHANITEEERELIFYKNALKLLDRNFKPEGI